METITEDFCSYEVAKLLKEKGFDEPCIRHWDCDDNSLYGANDIPISNSELQANEYNGYAAPTHQMAMKWLRKGHNYHTEIERNFEYFHNGVMHKPSYDAVVQDIANKDNNYFVAECNTYEEAVEAALKYSLENLI